MLIDCHLHTARFSGCSEIEPLEACELARQAGLSAIVLTEHQRLWPAFELAKLRRLARGLAVFSGMEISLAEGYDLVVIGPNLPFELPYGLTLPKLRQALSGPRQEVFVFLAHAFRYVPYLDEDVRPILAYVDALESNSVNILRNGRLQAKGMVEPLDLALYEKARLLEGLKPIYNSDGHRKAAVGTIASRLETGETPRDEAELARWLKTDQISQWQNPERLQKYADLYLS